MERVLCHAWQKRARSEPKCISVRAVQERIGQYACQAMLIVHALGGCNTTSALFGIGKGSVYSLLKDNGAQGANVEIMHSPSASPDCIVKAGPGASTP
jgi:hypothetical protein